MREIKNLTLFAGETASGRNLHANTAQNEKKGLDGKSLSLSGQDILNDRILQKRQDARNKASKFIRDQFSEDKKIDDSMQQSRDQQAKLTGELVQNNQDIADLKAMRQELQERYGITEESDIQSPEFSDYRSQLKEIDSALERFGRQNDKNLLEIGAESSSIAATKLGLLSRKAEATILGASENAENTLKAASDEIIGLLKEAAMEHMEEELKEQVDAAEKKAEEKEEEEKLQENKKEERLEQEEQIQQPAEAEPDTKQSFEIEMKQILDNHKLLSEDLKGLKIEIKT